MPYRVWSEQTDGDMYTEAEHMGELRWSISTSLHRHTARLDCCVMGSATPLSPCLVWGREGKCIATRIVVDSSGHTSTSPVTSCHTPNLNLIPLTTFQQQPHFTKPRPSRDPIYRTTPPFHTYHQRATNVADTSNTNTAYTTQSLLVPHSPALALAQ